MPGPDLSVEAIGKLGPKQLVELLSRLSPTDPALRDLDVDAIGRLIDPVAFSAADLVSVLSDLARLRGEHGIDLSRMGAQTFARLITHASKDQVAAMMAVPEVRALVLGEVFRRMGTHLRADRAQHVEAVVHWRFPHDTSEDYDRYETIISGGVCTVGREKTADPRVTITVAHYEFLRLVTSNASAPVLFMTGKLKVRGDLAFAAGLIGLFDLPSA